MSAPARPTAAPVTVDGAKPIEAIWTRLLIDPPAGWLTRRLVGISWVTPNRVTCAAGVLALVAAGAFAAGYLVLGAIVFQLRFLIDCVDGRIARARGTSTTWGAALDLIVDTLGIVACYLALASYLATTAAAPMLLPSVLLASYLAYTWTLAYRKSLPGGGQHDWLRAAAEPAERTRRVGPWQRYTRAMARRGMVPTPYALEVEALAVTLLPILAGVTGNTGFAVAGLWSATAFYVLASGLNVVRIRRLARRLDNQPDARDVQPPLRET